MTRDAAVRARIVTALIASCALLVAADAGAQAWVPAKGEGAVALAVQSQNVRDHILTTTWVDVGHIDSLVVLADVSYGLTDKLAVDLAMPFVSSKYTGTRPHPTALDDGTFHHSFTDFRFSLRYNVKRDGVVITPYIGTIVPSHSYEYFAHSAPGERLHELQVGAYVAKLFDRGLPGTFISGRYAFGFVEEILDISHNRSMGDLEIGYFLTPSIRTFAMTNAQYTHGGIDLLPVGGLAALRPEYRAIHDQIDRSHHINIGAGAAFSLNESMDVFGSFVRTVAGRNEHALNRAVTVGASWSFRRRSANPIAASAPGSSTPRQATNRQEGSLVRCICQKSGS